MSLMFTAPGLTLRDDVRPALDLQVGEAAVLANGVSGTLQVNWTSWFGTGQEFEVYGTGGMRMLAKPQRDEMSELTKDPGYLEAGESFGARLDTQQVLRASKPPEATLRDIKPICMRVLTTCMHRPSRPMARPMWCGGRFMPSRARSMAARRTIPTFARGSGCTSCWKPLNRRCARSAGSIRGQRSRRREC